MKHPHISPAAPDPDAVFNADWLALRAEADAAARNVALTLLARDWLLQRSPSAAALQCVDLGCGTGANAAFLSARLPGAQHWLLLDHDETLLARAAERSAQWRDEDGKAVQVRTRCCDLRTLQPALIEGADLVTASALIDLVGADWLQQLAGACAEVQAALLVVLSVDGCWQLTPTDAPGNCETDPDDAFVRAAFNDHQRRDKGVGGALGPDAATTLAAALRNEGFDVQLVASPWRLPLSDSAQQALAFALLDGWRDAAIAQCPQAATRIVGWHTRRRACLREGRGVLELGHVDLLALPGSQKLPTAL